VPTPVSGPGDLTGTVALVTGAARGIGAATAATLARAGADVVALDVTDCTATCSAVTGHGRRAEQVLVDLADRAALRRELTALTGRLPVGVVVNNAGILSTTGIGAITDAEWDRVVEVNLTACMVVTRAVWPGLVERGGGALVYVGSRAARTGGNNAGPAYVATKGALHALAVSVAREGAPHAIRANAVMPGPVATELTRLPSYADAAAATPVGRMGDPADIAEAVLYLASPASAFVTGTVLNVSGGLLMG
jgi:3-oxoacyl-[acyl-carrier protein] reductase